MDRRSFIETAGAAVLSHAPTAGEGEIKLSSSALELSFDNRSGALKSLRNKDGRSLAIPVGAASPVRLHLGTRDNPDQLVAVIAQNNPQPFEHRLSRAGGDTTLELVWRDVHASGKPTGIALRQSCTVSAGDNFARLRISIDNRGPHWVTSLFVGLEGLRLGDDPAAERLMAGDVAGRPYVDPRRKLPAGNAFVPYPAGKRSFSVPPTVPTSLIATWLDFADGRGGLGVGYLDRDMDLAGHVNAGPEGLDLGWRLFRLEGTRGFMWGINGPQQIYPLAPGEQFSTEEWILVFHAGDWHQTADAYSRRYHAVLKGDYLDWERTAPAVRECDVILNNQIAWGNPSKDKSRAYDYPNGHVVHQFDEIAPLMKEAMAALEVKPEHVIVFALGTGPDWGIYRMPDHFPMNEPAGGQAAADRMVRDLKQAGVAGVACYAHPYFMHRGAKNYVAEADTGWNYPHQDWHTSMGGIACMGQPAWAEMWRREVYPRYAAMGVTGLYMDEGFGHQFICNNPSHSHGGSALSVLTAQSQGATRLYKAFREVVGPGAFLSCETASDVQARFIDLWHLNPNEALRFTHPDRMMMANIDPRRPGESVARAFLFGCPVLVMPSPEAGASVLKGELLESLRRFVALRREMRDRKAPGYPNGFRDTAGLTIRGGELRAKVFAGAAGVTVAYYAEKPFAGEVIVDKRRRAIKASGKELGYVILQV